MKENEKQFEKGKILNIPALIMEERENELIDLDQHCMMDMDSSEEQTTDNGKLKDQDSDDDEKTVTLRYVQRDQQTTKV